MPTSPADPQQEPSVATETKFTPASTPAPPAASPAFAWPSCNRAAPPSIFVVCGASGDLTKRKLVPALYNLAAEGLLPENWCMIGVAGTEFSDAAYREKLREDMRQFASGPVRPELLEALLSRVHYLTGDFENPNTYVELGDLIDKLVTEQKAAPNVCFYLAVAPRFFGPIVQQLGAAGLTTEGPNAWRRVVFEKPFGQDLSSAKALTADIKKHLTEEQIFRIDHYLGKETVQNILVMRFSNSIFEPIWNRRYIDHVQITAVETVGVESRGGYYDTAGALRDMLPNHLFQLLTLTAMEPPTSFEANAVHDEQSKVLASIPPLKPEEVLSRAVRGQYGPGSLNGKSVPGYRMEKGVAPNSNTETFAALKLSIDNWRWADVPFYLRTGKRFPERASEIAIQFRRAPFQMFRSSEIESLRTNRLVIHIQPDEGISLRFGAKVPGSTTDIGTVQMRFDYSDYFGEKPSTGYERLIYDCMLGDQTLFQRADMVEAAWGVITPVLDVWSALPARDFPNYAAGSWGPPEADELLARDGRMWRLLGDERPPFARCKPHS
jgi:glucose-6-phosphate 1-dehydrogenase